MKKVTVFTLIVVLVLALGVVARAQDSPLASPTPEPSSTPEPNPNPLPDPGDEDSLRLVLLWIIGGGGAGVLVYWLIGNVKWLGDLPPAQKRFAALGLSALFACLAFVAAVGLSYLPEPDSAQAWLEQLFAIGFAVVMTSQVAHGWQQLPREKRRPPNLRSVDGRPRTIE